jgi:hypothetical protein
MYSAQVYYKSREGHSLTPMYPKIGSLETHLYYLLDMNKYADDVKEIVILKGGRRKMPTIHGYYDWVKGKLKLDKSKPVMIHNILYGLGG